ncbi:unnamed protein product [Hanseniaspora opuntiae]
MSSISLKYFDPFNIFDTIKHELESNFPLNNVYYKRTDDEPISTINKLDLKFTNDTALFSSSTFMSVLVISCSNINEYRNKIRPVINQWISNNKTDEFSKSYRLYVFLIQTTVADVNDNKMFNRKNINEKIHNDFSEINHIIQFPSFFKSLEEKNQLFTSVCTRIQKSVLSSLNMKLDIIEGFESDLLYVYMQKLNLYLKFGLLNQASETLNKINTDYLQNEAFIKQIDLGTGFQNYNNNINQFIDYNNINFDVSFSSTADESNVNYMDLLKYKMVQSLRLLTMKHQPLLHSEIKTLYKVVLTDFIYKIKVLCCHDCNVDVFIYNFITNFIMEHKLLKMNLNDEVTVPHQNKLQWNEFLGQLAYTKRQTWASIIDKKAILDFKINDHTVIDTNGNIDFDLDEHYSLQNVLEDYISMTQHVVSYWKETKPISIDLLASDIGILLNKAGQHEKTVAILHSTFEYYHNVFHWDDLAIQILEVYIDALEKMYSKEHPSNVIIDDELVPVVTVLANAYLNLICLLKDKKSYLLQNQSMRSLNFKQNYWKKFLQLNDNTDLTYPLDKIINFDLTLNSNLNFDSQLNVFYYFVKLEWDWLIDSGIVVKANNVKLKMRNIKNDRIVVFENNEVTVSGKKEILELKCYDIEFGSFELVSLEVFLNNNDTVFLKNFDQGVFVNLIPLYDDKKLNILINPSSEYYENQISLDINYENYEHLINKDVSLEIQVVESGKVYIKDCNLDVEKITFEQINPRFNRIVLTNNNADMPDANRIVVTLMITTITGNKFREVRTITKSILNPLDISHDFISKQNTSYLNLSISSILEPANITGTQLILNDKEISTSLDSTVKNILLPNNPLSKFKNFFSLNDTTSDKTVEYVVHYKTLRFAIEEYLTSIFFNKYPDLKCYKIIWRDYILAKFEFHINQFIHFKIIKLKVYDEIDFSNYLKSIHNKDSDLNEKFMNILLNVYRILFEGIPVKDSDEVWSLGTLQTIRKEITFEQMDVQRNLFTIHLNKKFDDVNLKMGECYSFDIVVNKNIKSDINKSYNCVVELNEQTNTWLLSGFNTFQLDESKDEETFELILIPIKRGYLKYPNIAINAKHLSHMEQPQEDHFITDFVNNNENIIVI